MSVERKVHNTRSKSRSKSSLSFSKSETKQPRDNPDDTSRYRSRSRSRSTVRFDVDDDDDNDDDDHDGDNDHDDNSDDDTKNEDNDESEDITVKHHIRDIVLNNGKRYPLYLTYDDTTSRTSISSQILLSRDYPNTALAKALRITQPVVARAMISFGQTGSTMNTSFCMNRHYFPWKNFDDTDAVEIVFLNAFYVNANDYKYQNISSTEEKTAFRGLGKFMLCQLMQYAISQKRIRDMKLTYVVAEADGGNPDAGRVAELSRLSQDSQWLLLLKRYPFATIKYLLDSGKYGKDTNEPLPEYISRVEENSRLIDYYMKTYGFRLLQDGASTGALIGVPVTTLMDHCK